MGSKVSGVDNTRPIEAVMQDLGAPEALAQWPGIMTVTIGFLNQLLNFEQTRRIKSGTEVRVSGLLADAGLDRQYLITDASVSAPQLASSGGAGATLSGDAAVASGSLALIEQDRLRRISRFSPWRTSAVAFDYDCRMSASGRVGIDLGQLENPKFRGVGNDLEQRLLGEFFTEQFAQLPDAIRQSTLLEKVNEGRNPLLHVNDVDVRIQRPALAQEDQVVFLIGTQHSQGGNYPSGHFVNLMADDLTNPCAAALALDGTLAPLASLVGAASNLFSDAVLEPRHDAGGRLTGMTLKSGRLTVEPYSWVDGVNAWTSQAFDLSITDAQPLVFTRGDFNEQLGAAGFAWATSGQVNVVLNAGARQQQETVRFALDLNQLLRFWGADGGRMGGELFSPQGPKPEVQLLDTRYGEDTDINQSLSDFITFAILNTWLSRFGPEIDPDMPSRLLDNLRWSNGQSHGFDLLDQRGGHQGAFGRAGVGSSALVINEQARVLGLDQKLVFTVSPDEGVRWSVTALDGPATGRIDRVTGEYTPPAADEFTGIDTRVVISARSVRSGVEAESILTLTRQTAQLDTVLLSALQNETYEVLASQPSGRSDELHCELVPPGAGTLSAIEGEPGRYRFTRATVPANSVSLASIFLKDRAGAVLEECALVLRNPGAARMKVLELDESVPRVRVALLSTGGSGGAFEDVEWSLPWGGDADRDLVVEDMAVWFTPHSSTNAGYVVLVGTYVSPVTGREVQDSIELTLPLRHVPGEVDSRHLPEPEPLTHAEAARVLESTPEAQGDSDE